MRLSAPRGSLSIKRQEATTAEGADMPHRDTPHVNSGARGSPLSALFCTSPWCHWPHVASGVGAVPPALRGDELVCRYGELSG